MAGFGDFDPRFFVAIIVTFVVAITVHETLDTTAQLPVGVWLATGGVMLLSAGVAMERRGVGPFETGRRLVDVIRERFV